MLSIHQRRIQVVVISVFCVFIFLLSACKPEVTEPIDRTGTGSSEEQMEQDDVSDEDLFPVLPDDAVTAISPTQGDVQQISSSPEPTSTLLPPTETPKIVLPTLTLTRTPTRQRAATKTAAPTMTPIPPYAQLLIQEPGPLSKIVSPLYCEYGVYTAGDGMLYIDLLDEQGVPIIHKELYLYQGLSKRIYSSINLDFELDAAAIASRLVFSTRDYFDRLVALSSVDVILLQLGSDELNPVASLYEPYIIQSPISGNYVEGGVFTLKGMLRLVNSAPIMIELVTEDNQILDSTSMDAALYPDRDIYSPFEISIDYSVQNATRVRLLIWQGSDNRIPGVVAANSIPLTLYP